MINILHVATSQTTNNMNDDIGILPNTISTNKSQLAFKGFDLSNNKIGNSGLSSEAFIESKVTMLLYNRVGPQGEVLSSIVYMSLPQPVSDTDTIFGYDPLRAMHDSAVMSGWGLTSDVDSFAYTNSIRPSRVIVPKRDRALFTEAVNALSEAGMPSNILGKNTIVKDGWYTIVSMGIPNTNVGAADVEKGLWVMSYDGIYIAKEQYAPTSELSNTDKWHHLDNWADDISLCLAPTSNFAYNPWVSKDLMWLPTTDAIYTDAVIDYVKTLDPNSIYPTLRTRTRILDHYVADNHFAFAQYTLQTTDFLRTTYNFIGHDNY